MMVVIIRSTPNNSMVVDSMKKISTNLDRTRFDSRHWRPEILGPPEREEQWRRTEPVSGFSAVSAVSAAEKPKSRSEILITLLETAPAELLPEGLEEATAREAHDEHSPFATSNAERFTARKCRPDLAVNRDL